MIEYEIVRRKIKNIYISIKDGQVIVKAPLHVSKEKIDKIVNEKSLWIEKKINIKREDRSVDIKNKDYIYILGNKIKIDYEYVDIKKVNVFIDENNCRICLPINTKLKDNIYKLIESKIDKELKRLTQKYVLIAMDKYTKLTSLKPDKITIRKFKSIWGNCSSNKEIKINQKIIHYSIEQIEYVCLHELTHLKYMNHQCEFWSFVKNICLTIKKYLKA